MSTMFSTVTHASLRDQIERPFTAVGPMKPESSRLSHRIHFTAPAPHLTAPVTCGVTPSTS